MSPTTERRASRGGTLLGRASRFGLLGVLILFVAFFSVLKPDTFATWSNYRSILETEIIVVFLALAATLPLIVGQFDLSIASVFTFGQTLLVGLMVQHGWPVPLALVFTLALAALVGVVNGVAVARFKMNAFIVTLATGSIVDGAALAYSKGASLFGNEVGSLTGLARGSVAGVPLPVIYGAVATLVLALLLARFPVGRRMYAIGSNERAARLTGIATERYVVGVFVASALLACVGGFILGSDSGSAASGSGAVLLIPAFAGAFLGATAFTPGRFNVLGTVVAVYVVSVAVAGLQQLGVALWVQPVFQGATLLIAIGLSAWTQRLRAHRARLARLHELEEQMAAATADPARPAMARATS